MSDAPSADGNFERCVEVVLLSEGGFANDAGDPGGQTAFGISQRSYPNENIAAMTRERAVEIYRRDFWDVLRCDYLSGPVSAILLDIGVNQGTHAAAGMLQDAVGTLCDGIVGTKTLRAAANYPGGPLALAVELTARRCVRYSGTNGIDRFALGWFRRAVRVLAFAIS